MNTDPEPTDPQGSRRTDMTELAGYAKLLADIKARIQAAQTKAVLAVNAEMIRLYWGIGRLLEERQTKEGWGAAVIPRLANDLRNELPEVKGFSARNLDRMLAFARAYPEPGEFSPQAVAKSLGGPSSPQPVAKSSADSLLWQLPWGHHALLLEKRKPVETRRWYIAQTLAQGRSRATLMAMIDSQAHARQGVGTSNFAVRLLAPQSELVTQALKDPYLFDFLTIDEPFRERELETGLVRHLEKFLLELGQGFAFVARQYRLEVGEQEYFIDLLFFHVRLLAASSSSSSSEASSRPSTRASSTSTATLSKTSSNIPRTRRPSD